MKHKARNMAGFVNADGNLDQGPEIPEGISRG